MGRRVAAQHCQATGVTVPAIALNILRLFLRKKNAAALDSDRTLCSGRDLCDHLSSHGGELVQILFGDPLVIVGSDIGCFTGR